MLIKIILKIRLKMLKQKERKESSLGIISVYHKVNSAL
jgi:hypothetical protein